MSHFVSHINHTPIYYTDITIILIFFFLWRKTAVKTVCHFLLASRLIFIDANVKVVQLLETSSKTYDKQVLDQIMPSL
jgi:hypothetical protein